jgi:hypothetical protein
MQSIDAQQLVQGLLAKSRKEGRDLWEVMEAEGLMLTSVRTRQIKRDAIAGMLFILERETAEKLLRAYLSGRPATAQDMFDAMVRWVQDYQKALEDGHVG